MNTRMLGTLKVSEIGFGTMSFASTYGPSPEKEEVIRVIRGAYELGVTLFDTAEAYGPFTNEMLVGEALEPIRDQVMIATKFGFDIDPATGERSGLDSRPEHIRTGRRCLAQAPQDRPHRPALPAPRRSRSADRGRRRHGQGTDRGGQGEALWPVRSQRADIRRAHAVQPVTAMQSEYSLWWRDPEQEILPALEELGIGFVPCSPLGTGLPDRRDRREHDRSTRPTSATTSPRFTPERAKANQALVDLLRRSPPARRRRRPRSRSPGCWRRSPGSCRSPARTKLDRLRRISARRRRATAPTISRRSRPWRANITDPGRALCRRACCSLRPTVEQHRAARRARHDLREIHR